MTGLPGRNGSVLPVSSPFLRECLGHLSTTSRSLDVPMARVLCTLIPRDVKQFLPLPSGSAKWTHLVAEPHGPFTSELWQHRLGDHCNL